MIRIDKNTTAESTATCECGKQVWFGLRVEGGGSMPPAGPLTQHEKPVCDLFVKLDSDAFRKRIEGKKR